MTSYIVTRIIKEERTLAIEVPEGVDPEEYWDSIQDDVEDDDWEFTHRCEDDEIGTIEEI